MQRFGRFNSFFLPVADAPLAAPPKPAARMPGRAVRIKNAGFETGFEGWIPTGNVGALGVIETTGTKPHEGKTMAGWLRRCAGEADHELYARDRLEQSVEVRPGRWYQLSAWVLTAEPAWSCEQRIAETWTFPFFQNRCRDRVALIADPQGGQDFEGANATQWYSTEGEWMLATRCFQAESPTIRIGAAFYQRGQREWDAAVIDDFQLVELETAPF